MPAAPLRSDLLLLLTAAIWGFAFVAQRLGMEHVGPFTYNGLRFGLGVLSLLPVIALGRHRPGPTLPSAGGRLFLVGGALLGVVLFAAASLQQVALLYTTVGKAGFITGLYVVIVPLSGVFWGRRPSAGTLAGALLAATGLYLLSVGADFEIAPGDLLVLASALFWSAQVLLVAYLAPRTRAVDLAAYQFAVCAVSSLAAAVALEELALEAIRAAALPVLYGGLLSVGVAFTLQVVAQRDAHPAHAAILMSLEAVFAAVGGRLILGETLDGRGLFGCGLMLAGMIASQLGALRR